MQHESSALHIHSQTVTTVYVRQCSQQRGISHTHRETVTELSVLQPLSCWSETIAGWRPSWLRVVSVRVNTAGQTVSAVRVNILVFLLMGEKCQNDFVFHRFLTNCPVNIKLKQNILLHVLN